MFSAMATSGFANWNGTLIIESPALKARVACAGISILPVAVFALTGIPEEVTV